MALSAAASGDWGAGTAVPGAPRIDLEYALETPENAILTFQLAGPAARLLAYLLDLMMMILIGGVGAIVIMLFLASLGLPALGGGIVMILMFLLQWWYFALLEWVFRGRTIGKKLLNLRTVMDGGYPLTFFAAVLRNFLRAADCLPYYGFSLAFTGIPFEIPVPIFGVGLLSMLMTRDFRRTGDLVARTIVVAEGRREAMTVQTGADEEETIVVVKSGVPLPQEPIILDRITPLNRSQIGGFVPQPRTLALIELFLGRRYALTYRRGHDMAAVLAQPLAKRLNYEGDKHYLKRYPMAFLASVYATFHRTLDEDGE